MTAGAPTKYKDDYAKQASNLCWLGATNADLARSFGVAVSTIDKWLSVHEEFSGAIKKAREEADLKVTKSLFQRAVGYSHPDTHFSNFQGEVTATPTTKHYPPETTAAIFWLKNRRPDEWREQTTVKVEHEIAIKMEQAAISLDKKIDAVLAITDQTASRKPN